MIPAYQLPFASAICGGLVALGVIVRARSFLARWAFALGMVILSIESLLNGYAMRAGSVYDLVYWQEWRLVSLSIVPGTWLLFSLYFARGNARAFLAKWRILVVGVFLVPTTFAIAFRESLFSPLPPESEVGIKLIGLSGFGVAIYLVVLLVSVLVLMNLERTFRASVGTMRWRIKFILLAVSVLFVARIYTTSQALLFRAVDLSLETVNSTALVVATLLILRSFFRAGHFDMDVYPSQSVLQGSFTIVLAGLYLLIVGIAAKTAVYLGGSTTLPLTAFLVLAALVALTIALQSDRARLYSKRFVSRHFERPFYDYRLVWQRFTQSTASQVDQRDLCRTVVRLVAEVFETLSVSLWLLDDKRDAFVVIASTSLSESPSENVGMTKRIRASELLSYFRSHTDPVDIEPMTSDWSLSLRELHPSEFPNGGHRLCAPIVGRGEVLGILVLGDRVAGAPFSIQDIDMLKCVRDHVAAGLLNVQLSQQLLQAKELEAFQTMAAFFVHDLKNSASTLNLMLQNLPVHFEDPAFREDALRGASKAVHHINQIIGRLGLLRHDFKLNLVASDLSEVVDQALPGIEIGTCITLKKMLAPVPSVMIDREQITKVVINLMVNARESFNGEGEVTLSTFEKDGWIVLSVADHGCGMSQEFIDRSLFRPFQTTKKNGLGIGMFQSKMIVEAHGGRMIVESKPGEGSTFQVVLPAAPFS